MRLLPLLAIVCPAVPLFFLTLVLIGIPGMLGGLTTAVFVYLNAIYVDKNDKTKWPPSGNLRGPVFFLAQAATGFGGAVAALLVILWANRFPDNLCDLRALLTLASIGYVAGYVANRLLPAIAESVYNKLTQLAQETKQNNQELQNAQSRIVELTAQNQRTERLSTELVAGSRYLNGKVFTQTQTDAFTESLGSLAKQFPVNRTLNLLLAALYTFAAKNHDGAIAVLEQFIAAKTAANQGEDEDTASAYWNIANDREEQFKERGDTQRRKQAVDALRKALSIRPDVYVAKVFGSGEAEGDSDFSQLVASAEGQQLRAEFIK